MRKKKGEKYITIVDVAEKADVSIATVSRVQNGGKVSEKLKKRVDEAIKELNYVPNGSARQLASVRTPKNLTLIIPTIELRCYVDLVKGFKTVAKLYKYEPTIEEDNLSNIKCYNTTRKSFEMYRLHEESLGAMGESPDDKKIQIVDLDDKLLEFSIAPEYRDKRIGIYFAGDESLADFFIHHVFKESICKKVVVTEDEQDMYVVQSIEQAMELYNHGIRQKIYVLEPTTELNKYIPNIKTLKIDFYAIGVGLSRILIKKIVMHDISDTKPLLIEVS